MIRWLAALGACVTVMAVVVAAGAPDALQAKVPRKIFISVDMEGVAGVVQPAQLGPDGFEYGKAREWVTGEVKAVFNAAIAGHFGVPVVFMSGDRIAVAQVQKTLPAVEGVVVKEPYGFHSALTVTPATSQQLIREGVTRALKKGGAAPYRLKAPIELEVGFKLTPDAELAAYVPGLVRVDTHTVRGTFTDMLVISRLMQILTSLP